MRPQRTRCNVPTRKSAKPRTKRKPIERPLVERLEALLGGLVERRPSRVTAQAFDVAMVAIEALDAEVADAELVRRMHRVLTDHLQGHPPRVTDSGRARLGLVVAARTVLAAVSDEGLETARRLAIAALRQLEIAHEPTVEEMRALRDVPIVETRRGARAPRNAVTIEGLAARLLVDAQGLKGTRGYEARVRRETDAILVAMKRWTARQS